ncbi:transmembrane protein, putative, partial [Bodo saltans]
MWSCCGCSDDVTLSTGVEHNNTSRGSTSVNQRARSHQRIPHPQRSEFGDDGDDTSPLEGIASASSHGGGGGGGASGFFGRGLRRADGLMFTHHNDSLSLAGANSHRHRQRWRRSPNGGIYLDNGDGTVSQSSSSSSGHFALTAIGNWLRLFWSRVLAKREDLFVWLGLCHEDPYLELQFQIYFYNSQRIVSMVFCISAFAFCLGGTALWVSTIDIFFVFWDCFGVLVWGVCAAMLVWLYRKHRVIVEQMDELSSHISGGILGSAGRGAARGDNDDSDDDDGDGGDEHDDSRNGHSYNNKHNHSQQGGAPANASLFRLSTLSHSTRQFGGGSPSSSRIQRRIARLEEELRWNTTWHERFLLVANMTSVWFSVGLTGAQGSCDYVREDRRVLDCRNAINTEGLMFMFVSAAVFLSQTRLSFSWPIFPVWAGAVIGVLKAAVPNIVDTYFATFAFLLVFELAVALGTLWIREWRRRADFENFIKRQDRAAEVNIVRLQTQRMLTVQLPPEVTRMLMVGHQQWKKK